MLAEYYADPNVQARLVEFMGGRSLGEATAQFISTEGRSAYGWYNPLHTTSLPCCTSAHSELARSLCDRDSLLVDLDMEYVNFDDPAEPYRDFERSFRIQRPVVEAIEELLAGHGIAPLHLLSGRGHHFIWRINRHSPAFGTLSQLGRLPESVIGKYAESQPPCGERVPVELGAAFAGLGMVMEHFAHQILAAVDGHCEIPIELTAVEVGLIRHGREIVSLDVSEYGDPLHTRTTRMPFSRYLKSQHYSAGEDDHRHKLPPLFVIPLFEMDERQALDVMRDAPKVRSLARRASVQIPDQSRGMEALLASYQASRLARFHDYFYQADHDSPDRWPTTYDRTPLDPLPRCVSIILRNPNDLLLKPAGIQHVVRTLTALGWHPRHIAGLIRSKYERNYNWTPGWYVYDAALRSDFYTRLFTGLTADNLDPLVDYNCKSTQEKGYCCSSGCGEILENHRLLLVERSRDLQDIARPVREISEEMSCVPEKVLS